MGRRFTTIDGHLLPLKKVNLLEQSFACCKIKKDDLDMFRHGYGSYVDKFAYVAKHFVD